MSASQRDISSHAVARKVLDSSSTQIIDPSPALTIVPLLNGLLRRAIKFSFNSPAYNDINFIPPPPSPPPPVVRCSGDGECHRCCSPSMGICKDFYRYPIGRGDRGQCDDPNARPPPPPPPSWTCVHSRSNSASLPARINPSSGLAECLSTNGRECMWNECNDIEAILGGGSIQPIPCGARGGPSDPAWCKDIYDAVQA